MWPRMLLHHPVRAAVLTCSVALSTETSRRHVSVLAAAGSDGSAPPAAAVPRIVVKMGGSAITVKHQLETLNEPALDATAQHIAAAVAGGVQLAVLHGAGSFGHFQARQFGISKGSGHPAWSAWGFADTRRAVTELHREVVGRLVAAKVPAVGLSPFPTTTTQRKALLSPGVLAAVKDVLEQGFVPVLHGDAVLDADQGSAIVSGDLILDSLCRSLAPSAAVFLTDVPGVFTQPPSEPGATLIPEILVSRDGTCALPVTSTAAHDVTGGIAEKLQTAIAVVTQCEIPVYVVQVGTEHAAEALAGRVPRIATVLRLKAND